MKDRFCIECNSIETYIDKTGLQRWYKHDNGFICHKCYCKLFIHPKWNAINNPINHKVYNPKRLRFKDKHMMLKENPRTGICSQCGARKGIECKKTDIHHIQYDPEDPLKYTIELCPSCHRNQHIMMRNAELKIKWDEVKK